VYTAKVMICPECKAEYRVGFTRCADCDVELVEAPVGALATMGAVEDEARSEDPFCEFWKGEDARVRGELCDVLSEAGIPYRTVEWQDHLFHSNRSPIFRVAVPFSMFERAERAVAAAYGSAEDAERIMHPQLEDSPELQRLLALPLEEKWRQDREPNFLKKVMRKWTAKGSENGDEEKG
jgi:hypothetical protein